GFWSLVDNTYVDPYMTTAQGSPIYQVGKKSEIGLGPYCDYAVAGLEPSHSNASHLMNAAELRSDTKGLFDYDLVGTQYNFLRDYTNSYVGYGFTPTATSNPLLPTYTKSHRA